MYILQPFCPFSSFSNRPSIPLLPITLLAVYPSPACSSKSSAVTLCTYPTKCAAASPNGYSRTSTSDIITPGIASRLSCRSFSFNTSSSGSTFSSLISSTLGIVFIGTKESSFTHCADNFFSITSGVVSSNSAILAITSSLFSNFPGTIPTEDAVPFPASTRPFLSRISPLFACVVETLTLSVEAKFGKISESSQTNLYPSSPSRKNASFSKLISPATVSKDV